MWGKMGRKGRNPVHRILSCHILKSPQRVVGALSCLTTSSMISAFGVAPPGVFSSHCRATPVPFHSQWWCLSHSSEGSWPDWYCYSLFCSWTWFYIQFCGFHYLSECRLLLILHFLTDFFGFHFLFLPSPRWALIPLLLCSTVIGSRMLKSA